MAKRSGMGWAALLLVAALGCGDGGHATGVDGDQQARPRRVLAIDDREVRPQRRVVRRLGPERLDQAEPVRVLCARSVAFPLLTDGRL